MLGPVFVQAQLVPGATMTMAPVESPSKLKVPAEGYIGGGFGQEAHPLATAAVPPFENFPSSQVTAQS